MDRLRVALVSRDPALRAEMARAFDAAPLGWEVTLHADPVPADVVVYGPDVRTCEGYEFDPAHPGSILDLIRAGSANGSGSVTVTSTGGGAGTTTVALHLAARTAARRRCCFVDLDRAWGVRFRLGLDEIKAWAPHEEPMETAVPLGGFRVLVPRPDVSPEDVAEMLDRACSSFEVVVIDAPDFALLDTALDRSRAGVLVMPATVPGAKKARIVCGEREETRWAIVANRLGAGGETTATDLQRTLGRRIALELPCTPRLRDVEEEGRLLTSRWTRWTWRIDALARALDIA